ncbi:hypothetical protein KFU94_54285 [Chloroflexi bacterium TSY]|nr:hypothetical protein [Chloroflexi bacterium TSY]
MDLLILALSSHYLFAMLFVLQFSGRSDWLTKKSLGLLLVEPLITFVLILTNDHHELILQPGWHVDSLPLMIATWSHGGSWLLVDLVYGYGLSLIAFALLVQDSVDPNLAFLAIFSRDCRDFGVIYSDFGYRKQPISYLKIAQI